jgi:hypothetical protein
MRTATHPSSVSAFSRLLTCDCLRYAVAKPSLWPRTRGCKRRVFSNFGSDSPLNFSWLRSQFSSLRENLRACLSLVLRSTASFASAFRLQRLMTVDRASIYLAWRFPCLFLCCKSRVDQARLFVYCTPEPAIQ